MKIDEDCRYCRMQKKTKEENEGGKRKTPRSTGKIFGDTKKATTAPTTSWTLLDVFKLLLTPA